MARKHLVVNTLEALKSAAQLDAAQEVAEMERKAAESATQEVAEPQVTAQHAAAIEAPITAEAQKATEPKPPSATKLVLAALENAGNTNTPISVATLTEMLIAAFPLRGEAQCKSTAQTLVSDFRNPKIHGLDVRNTKVDGKKAYWLQPKTAETVAAQ